MNSTEDETDSTLDAIDSLHSVMVEIKELLSKIYAAKDWELSQRYKSAWNRR